MDERIKKMELREDGFLEIMLKRVKDFDDYIYQQIQKDGSCLPCIRDHRSKSKFYFDTKGYVNMHTYLKSHIFEKSEILSFLLYILGDMVKANAAKPVSMDLTHIFLGYDGGNVRFLVFPLAMDNWVFQKEQCKTFLIELIKGIRLLDGYDAIGYLVYALKMEEISLPVVLQGLHDIKEQQQRKPTMIEKLFHIHREDTYSIQDIPTPIAYPSVPAVRQVMEEEHLYSAQEQHTDISIHSETVVLFAQQTEIYMYDEDNKVMIMIDKEEFTIGRASDNTLCVDDLFVSAYHAVIHTQSHCLEDLNSSNGSYVNGKRIHTKVLQKEDTICFGRKKYRYKVDDRV